MESQSRWNREIPDFLLVTHEGNAKESGLTNLAEQGDDPKKAVQKAMKNNPLGCNQGFNRFTIGGAQILDKMKSQVYEGKTFSGPWHPLELYR